MVEKFQDCKVREANSPELFWKLYRYLYKDFMILGISLCIPIIIFISPLYFISESYGILVIIILLLTIFPFGFLGFMSYRSIRFLSSSKHHKIWILEKNGKLIAIACFEFKYEYSNLVKISVVNGFRNKGYGSYLVRWLCQNVSKPIYAYPVFGLADFYTKLGFSFPKLEKLPAKLRSNPKAIKRYKIMVYE
jgi:N-acetylglutamate synthase-like GNAT family acetyltransferase